MLLGLPKSRSLAALEMTPLDKLPEIHIRLTLRHRDRETEILPRQMRYRAGELERIERTRRVVRFPPTHIAQPTRLEPQLDATLTLEQSPAVLYERWGG